MNQQYLHYSIDDWAADEAVHAYVLRGENTEAWQDWLTAHPDAAQRFTAASELIQALQQLKGEASADQIEQIWGSIRRDTAPSIKIVSLDVQRKRQRRIIAWGMAVAASLLLLFLLQPEAKVWSTSAGQTQLVYLPDSTAVWLAPESKLVLGDYDETRLVELAGEAFFDVKKGAAFRVLTPEGQVSVLGTSFRVDASAGQLSVRCQSGLVRVTRESSIVMLQAGQSVSSQGNALTEVRSESVSTEPNPDEHRFVVRDVPVSLVVSKLGRYYARSSKVSSQMAERRVTIELPTDDFSEAIRRLSFVLRSEIDTLGGHIRVGE